MSSSFDLISSNYAGFSSSSGLSIPTGGIAGFSAANVAQTQQEVSKFQSLIDGIQAGINSESNLSSSQVAESGRLNGDYTSELGDIFNTQADKASAPVGAAANSGMAGNNKIDRTSKLYKTSLELESYFVKIMLSSMRNTVTKTNLCGKENEYASKMYEDMFYDELATTMTESAGFGLADQIYLQMSGATS